MLVCARVEMLVMLLLINRPVLRALLNWGLKYDNIVMEEAGQVGFCGDAIYRVLGLARVLPNNESAS
jgi:hypothetical protein